MGVFGKVNPQWVTILVVFFSLWHHDFHTKAANSSCSSPTQKSTCSISLFPHSSAAADASTSPFAVWKERFDAASPSKLHGALSCTTQGSHSTAVRVSSHAKGRINQPRGKASLTKPKIHMEMKFCILKQKRNTRLSIHGKYLQQLELPGTQRAGFGYFHGG